MLFAAAVVALVSAAPLAFAQDLSVSAPSLAQCATSTLSLAGTNAPYYVAVVPAQNPCESDAIAEFFNVQGSTVDYTVALPEGTQVQLYVADNSGIEYWSEILTVGAGDAACLGGDSSSSSSTAPSSTEAPTTYVAPSAARATSSTRASSGSSGTNNAADSPSNAEAESSTSAGFKATASVTLIGGALAAAFALF